MYCLNVSDKNVVFERGGRNLQILSLTAKKYESTRKLLNTRTGSFYIWQNCSKFAFVFALDAFALCINGPLLMYAYECVSALKVSTYPGLHSMNLYPWRFYIMANLHLVQSAALHD